MPEQLISIETVSLTVYPKRVSPFLKHALTTKRREMAHSDLFDLSGKTAIVTGAGNGIGRASSRMLADAGARVVVSDYNMEAARAVADEINNHGGTAIAVDCDVTNDQALVSLVDKTIEHFGTINVLVNNVGGGGAVRTHALETVLTPEIEAKMLEHTPLQRLGEADDIAAAVLYFAAPISSWVSGQVLFVNGGGAQTLD